MILFLAGPERGSAFVFGPVQCPSRSDSGGGGAPGLPPGGGNGKGGVPIPRCRRPFCFASDVPVAFSDVRFIFPRGFGDRVSLDPFEDQLPEIAGFHPLVPRFYPHS